MSFSTLIVKPPVSGMKSPSASVATMIDDKLMAISASSSSFDAQPVVELVQQRERVRARRRIGDLQREHLTVARLARQPSRRCQQTPSAGCR